MASILVAASSAAAAEPLPYDLNGDGRQELVIGLPAWSADPGNRKVEAGGVVVVPGSATRLLGKAILLRDSTLGVPADERGGLLGKSVASGDFDGDGLADLAVGDPYGGAGGSGAGRVFVLYGARGSFRSFPSRLSTLDAPAVQEGHFAESLVAGDLNGDGFSDLVAGGRRDGERELVDIVFGSQDGLLHDGWRALDEPVEGNFDFGRLVALGDTNADGALDLFDGTGGYPVEDEVAGELPTPGRVTAAMGGASGPTSVATLRDDLEGGAVSLAVGDVTGDGYDDLVTGSPENEFYYDNSETDHDDEPPPPGAVRIFRGSADGPTADPIVITQETRGVSGSNEPGDAFGASVAVGRLDGDRYADIVVGASSERRGRGRVTVVRGGPKGTAGPGARHQMLTPGRQGLPEHRRGTRGFGMQVALLDHDGDGRLDLSVLEWSTPRCGCVTTLRGLRRARFATRGTRRLKVGSFGLERDYEPPVLGRPGGG